MVLPNRFFITSILFFLISFVGVAQVEEPPIPGPPPPPGMPIDTWVYVLLVVALLYGIIKKYKFSRK